jgi:hypothetical protein
MSQCTLERFVSAGAQPGERRLDRSVGLHPFYASLPPLWKGEDAIDHGALRDERDDPHGGATLGTPPVGRAEALCRRKLSGEPLAL